MATQTPITISDLTFIKPEYLASLVKGSSSLPAIQHPNDGKPTISIIDVRDSDHIGGHIRGSTWIPSHELPHKMPELVRTLADKGMVVFHCALSQERGPSAALKYARERQRILDNDKGNQEQKICVLEGGFNMWQARGYGEDPSLTEGYVKDIWED